MLRRAGSAIFHLFASYGFACVVFVLLLLLTFLGTLEQAHTGLYDVQKKYFDSLFLVHRLFGVIPIPLPGAYLVMSLLFLNLVCGGIVRIRKTRSRAGILLTHAGMLLMLVAGFVKHHHSKEGTLTLYEGESAAYFESWFDWEIACREAGAIGETTEYVIPVSAHEWKRRDGTVRYRSAALPFELELGGFHRNTRPVPAAGAAAATAHVVDGFLLQVLPPAKEAEQNLAGAYVTLADASGARHEGILWGLQQAPWVIEMGGRAWAVELRKRRWELPFTIVLDKFNHEMHPGTGIARRFTSEVTKIEAGASQRIHITMNQPLRHEGFTLYQSSWGPSNARPGEPLFSTFSVVRNPADQWPLYSCLVIAAGLLLHFVRKLSGYLRAENRRARDRRPVAAAAATPAAAEELVG
jgi:hypothetical protein